MSSSVTYPKNVELFSDLAEDGSLSDGIQRTNSAEDNGYESSIDNDDDISSDEDPEARKIESEVRSQRNLLRENTHQRSIIIGRKRGWRPGS